MKLEQKQVSEGLLPIAAAILKLLVYNSTTVSRLYLIAKYLDVCLLHLICITCYLNDSKLVHGNNCKKVN